MSVSFVYPTVLWLLLVLPFVAGIGIAARHKAGRARDWLALGLRLLLLLALILAIAGIQLRLDSSLLTTVFLLDASDSLSPQEHGRGTALIQQALAGMKSGDQAAVVVFGEDSLVERLASDDPILSKIASIPVRSRTDIASAIQLAFAIFPGEGARRIVLLSDGRENLGRAIEQAEYAAASQVELAYFPLGSAQPGQEVYLDRLHAPSEVRLGQDFELTAVVESSRPTNASLRIFSDGALIDTREVPLHAGRNELHIPVDGGEPSSPGSFQRFRAQILPDSDTNLQNNEASAFTILLGPPAVLVVEDEPGDGDNLVQALRQVEMRVTQLNAVDMPTTLSGLAEYESLALV